MKKFRAITPIVFGLLVLSTIWQLSLGELTGRQNAGETALQERISPVLLEHLNFVRQYPQYDQELPLIVQVDPDYYRQFGPQQATEGRENSNALPVIHGFKTRMNARAARQLLASPQVAYVTLDAVLHPTGCDPTVFNQVSSELATIGADQAQALGYSGEGINVAVFDSGIVKSHTDFGVEYYKRISNAIDFTSGRPIIQSIVSVIGDDYGHGTHVAGIIGGEGTMSAGFYRGVAPDVEFIDLWVVNEQGVGYTSQLIMAIDYLISRNDRYQVKVANLSLGHPPLESYDRDPLCQAVERLVEAGITTVVSAGNLGKLDGYPEVWGGITSPGNSPAVITVGAVDTHSTLTHSDDTATSFGSRGPTYIDNLFKPDLSAPGNGITAPLANGSTLQNQYPELHLNDDYVTLSGTSMAAAYVSGTAALMLQANPALTPRLVKTILMLSAVKLDQPQMLEQGNGLLNTLTAVQIAEALDPAAQTLRADVPLYWDLNGETVTAGGAFAFADRILYTAQVDTSLNNLWGEGRIWDESIIWSDGRAWSQGVFAPESVIWSDSVLWSDSILWADSVLWTDSILWSDSVLWSESVLWSDSVLWSESVLWADSYLNSIMSHNFGGDGSGGACEPPEPDKVDIRRAEYDNKKKLLKIQVKSKYAPDAVLTFSIENFAENTLIPHKKDQEYELYLTTDVNLDKRILKVSSSHSGYAEKSIK